MPIMKMNTKAMKMIIMLMRKDDNNDAAKHDLKKSSESLNVYDIFMFMKILLC